jgi:hypothetical protein
MEHLILLVLCLILSAVGLYSVLSLDAEEGNDFGPISYIFAVVIIGGLIFSGLEYFYFSADGDMAKVFREAYR